MTPLSKWLKKKAEQFAETRNEGPQAPLRLAQEVVMFAKSNPQATVSQWADFAARHAAAAYRSGYDRGYSWSAREDMGPKVRESERAAEEIQAAWTIDGVPFSLDEDGRIVPLSADERAEEARVLDRINEAQSEWDTDRRALGPSR
jgi:hypothetical protein